MVMKSNGVISTVAGNGEYGYSGDGGLATLARLRSPYGVAVDASGNIYIADVIDNRIRMVTNPGSDGVISTVAGDGTAGFSEDGVLAISARLNTPFGVCLDASGNIYIADNGNNRVRKIGGNTLPTPSPSPTALPSLSGKTLCAPHAEAGTTCPCQAALIGALITREVEIA